jgi:hypothetical protein
MLSHRPLWHLQLFLHLAWLWSSTILQNAGTLLLDYIVSHPRREQISVTIMRTSRISGDNFYYISEKENFNELGTTTDMRVKLHSNLPSHKRRFVICRIQQSWQAVHLPNSLRWHETLKRKAMDGFISTEF